MKELRTTLLVVFASTVILALPAAAQIRVIDYLGYGWETGQSAGDEFHFLGISDLVDPIFGVDLSVEELTLYTTNLVVLGSVDVGGGTTMISYSTGTMEIYQDPLQDSDWGINPPNATAPSTFVNGDLFFSGELVDLVMFRNSDGSGHFSGSLNGTGGSMIAGSCSNCVYSWGGTFTSGTGAQLIEGYSMQVDGVLEIDEAVSTDSAAWGSVKALYSN